MKRNYRPGSQGAAEQKATRNFLIGTVIILGLIFLELYFNVFNFYLGEFENRSPWYATVISLIPNGGVVFALFSFARQGDLGKNPVRNTLFILLALILGIMIACGFQFDLAGIEPR